MIYFRSLLPKRNPDIFLFQSVVRLITNARQNFETFEVMYLKCHFIHSKYIQGV